MINSIQNRATAGRGDGGEGRTGQDVLAYMGWASKGRRDDGVAYMDLGSRTQLKGTTVEWVCASSLTSTARSHDPLPSIPWHSIP